MYYEVIPTKLFRENAGILTYSTSKKLLPGQIVVVPLGRTTTPAIVTKRVEKPSFPTKEITKILYDTPLPLQLQKSLLWLSQYYLTPLPQIASLLLPVGITKTRRQPKTPASIKIKTPPKTTQIPLNPAQKTALTALQTPPQGTKLLQGVTGSGKTNIYLKMALMASQAHKSTILLVPEIALTSQLVQIFQKIFGQNVILIHSNQTEATRHQTWEKILNTKDPKIIIGPRSALLSPIKNLGLIIIDEAHESTYHQDQTPKYSALRLASFFGQTLKIPVIYGTATPLVTDYYLAKQKNALIPLTEKAKKTAIKPQITIIDLKNRDNFTKNRYFSTPLLNQIQTNLEQHYQTLIFHNRRGSAPLTLCEHCGWQALCPSCFLPLTLHTDTFSLICHTCGHQEKIPTSCPECHHTDILHKGIGTKLLESELKKLFKTAKIARYDADNKKSETLSENYNAVKNGEIDILIGTQTIAKGLDLPNLATVGIVQADAGLSLPDYAAEERTFHLLTQVLGRIGRGHLGLANAYIQTYQPDHPVITTAITEDYNAFSTYLLKKRRLAHLPPYTYLAKLTLTYKTEATVLKHIRTLHATLKLNPDLSVSTPTPTFHERTATGYTWQIVVKARSRAKLLSALSNLPKNQNLHLTLDPPSLL